MNEGTYTREEAQEKQGKRGREEGRETYTREEGDKEANQQQEERGTETKRETYSETTR